MPDILNPRRNASNGQLTAAIVLSVTVIGASAAVSPPFSRAMRCPEARRPLPCRAEHRERFAERAKVVKTSMVSCA